jgi:Tfp pilus assembly protein PilV
MTLVEVLVTMLILAGGLLSMASVQIQSMQGGQYGRHLTQASSLAASQLEQLQLTTWPQIPATSWTAPVTANAIQNRVDADQTYAISWRISTLVPNVTRAIDVRVNWTEANGRNRVVTLSSIRHNHEAL